MVTCALLFERKQHCEQIWKK